MECNPVENFTKGFAGKDLVYSIVSLLFGQWDFFSLSPSMVTLQYLWAGYWISVGVDTIVNLV